MLVCRSQKKYFRNFNFNFNYRELLSKSVLLACVVAALCGVVCGLGLTAISRAGSVSVSVSVSVTQGGAVRSAQ